MGIPAGKGSWRRPASTWRRSSPSTCSRGPCAGVGAATTLCSIGARGRSMAEEKKSGSKGAMTVSEAGRKGGVRVRETRGRKFYEEIGKKGGETVKAKRGRKFYEEIGKKGGETIKAERGTPFYEEIGRKGGHKVRELIEKGKAGAPEKEEGSGAAHDRGE